MKPELDDVTKKNIEAVRAGSGASPEEAIGATRRALKLIDELEVKFTPFSPRQTVIYPSIEREQCDLLRTLLASAKEQMVAVLAHYESALAGEAKR